MAPDPGDFLGETANPPRQNGQPSCSVCQPITYQAQDDSLRTLGTASPRARAAFLEPRHVQRRSMSGSALVALRSCLALLSQLLLLISLHIPPYLS